MTLAPKQAKFANMVALLILRINDRGYHVTFGDAYAKSGHMDNSLHYIRLAIDLNLFDKDWNYLSKTEDYEQFGIYWEGLDSECSWGGRFSDGNHFSLRHGGRR